MVSPKYWRADALTHIAEVMAPGGFLCFYEGLDVGAALFWGLSEQSWGFEDERDFALWCTFPRWDRLLTEAGFQQACRILASENIQRHLKVVGALPS